MPKREKTPSPGPDEPTFLSIYYPFPLYVTLEEEKETIECARWLACFIGQNNLYAMFHKPKSPNVIIVEISNELTDQRMRGILGEHDWDKVFVSYDRKEGYTKSQVFYSTFRTRREVEKTGWKIVEVQDSWFKGFNPSKGKKVIYPYPPTTFCEPPDFAEEAGGALRLFRYLPADLFPEAAGRVSIPSKPVAEPAPQPRVIPGSGRSVGVTQVKAGGKGKKKANANAAVDPTVRATAPLARTAAASAKAKVIHKQPNQVTVAAYDESDDDLYEAPSNDPEPDKAVEEVEKAMSKSKIGDASPHQEYHPLIFDKEKKEVDPSELCPTHNKRCKPGICEWAGEQRAKRKQRQKRTGGTAGQNMRQW